MHRGPTHPATLPKMSSKNPVCLYLFVCVFVFVSMYMCACVLYLMCSLLDDHNVPKERRLHLEQFIEQLLLTLSLIHYRQAFVELFQQPQAHHGFVEPDKQMQSTSRET